MAIQKRLLLPDGGGSLKKRLKASLNVEDLERDEKPTSSASSDASSKCKNISNSIWFVRITFC